MTLLATVVGIVLGLGVVFWAASRLGREVGKTDAQLEVANETATRLRDAVAADERVRRDIAAAGVYAPDENQRD